MTKLCDECETVAHCAKHGCIPKQPASVQGYVTGLDVYLDPADMKPKRYPAAQPAPVQGPVNQRAHEMAQRQWDHWKQYALELQERLVKYEGGAPMVLNTTPPAAQRQWVGLTDEEIMGMYNEPRSDAEMIAFGREVEAELRSKNGY